MVSLIPILSLIFLLITTFNQFGEASRVIAVGGSMNAWKVPESSNDTLDHWAAKTRFHVGDTLWWHYDSKIDSVLQVTKENYGSCNTKNPLKEHKDGNTTVKLKVSGPYFFISGASTGNCAKGEKVTVVVQSPHHPPMPKPGPGPAPPTPSPPTPSPPTPSPKPSTSPAAPAWAPAPAKNIAVGLVAGNGIIWALVAVIGLAFL